MIEIATDITNLKQAQQEIVNQEFVESKLRQLAQALISQPSLEEMSKQVLDAGKELTGSSFGFVGTLESSTGNMVAHTMTKTIWKSCQVPDKTHVFDKFSGLWGWVLKNQSRVMCNDPSRDPRSSGVPQGHIPISNVLSVPVILQGRTVGIIALANSYI